MARKYVMTARRKAALKKAQIASARKRRKAPGAKAKRKVARKARNRRIRAGAKLGLGVALVVAPGPSLYAASKALKYGAIGGIAAAHSPHYARGFKRGFTTANQRHKGAARHMRNAGIRRNVVTGRTIVRATATRAPQFALPRGR